MEKLRVALNGTLVGTLEKHAGGAMSFVYHEEWLAQAGARAISLSLPLQSEPFRGDVVYNFFDNSLFARKNLRYSAYVRIPHMLGMGHNTTPLIDFCTIATTT